MVGKGKKGRKREGGAKMEILEIEGGKIKNQKRKEYVYRGNEYGASGQIKQRATLTRFLSSWDGHFLGRKMASLL
jgi:hypothetical protein